MKHRMIFQAAALWAALLFAALSLAACSSSSSGGGGGTVREGVFIDALVEGLDYTTESQSGTTDAAGTFKYLEGETVTFTIGDFAMGEAAGSPVLTPWDLNADETNAVGFLSRVHFLNNVDDDQDPTNGIKIPNAARTALQGQTFDFASDTDTGPLLIEINVTEYVPDWEIDAPSALLKFTQAVEEDGGVAPESLVPSQGSQAAANVFASVLTVSPATIELPFALDAATMTAENILFFNFLDPSIPSSPQDLFISNPAGNQWGFYTTLPSCGPGEMEWMIVFTTRVTDADGVPLPTAFVWFFLADDSC